MEPSPVWGIVGPTLDVWNSDLRDAMEAFYRELLTTFDIRKALEAANESKPYQEWEYILEGAEIMYCRVFNHYLSELCAPKHLAARENEIVAEMVRRRNHRIEVAFDARDRARRMLSKSPRILRLLPG
ncbi:MAG TPA: hypothetical protein VES88_17330 [Gemmatimonadaceae bacterium]|nr:hypothetical protein [Gemmatimonadaceae bacterium]